MELSEKAKARLKKARNLILQIAGWLILLTMLGITRDALYRIRLMHCGPSFVGRNAVIYISNGHYLYTNVGAQVAYHFLQLLLIAGGVFTASFLTLWAIRKAGCLAVWKKKTVFLLAALFYAAIALAGSAIRYHASYRSCHAFWDRAEACKTLDDYRNMFGASILHKTVTADDQAFIKSIAWFKDGGFSPGRELHIFRHDAPSVYFLVWLENGDIVHVDWCFRASGYGNETLAP